MRGTSVILIRAERAEDLRVRTAEASDKTGSDCERSTEPQESHFSRAWCLGAPGSLDHHGVASEWSRVVLPTNQREDRVDGHRLRVLVLHFDVPRDDALRH